MQIFDFNFWCWQWGLLVQTNHHRQNNNNNRYFHGLLLMIEVFVVLFVKIRKMWNNNQNYYEIMRCPRKFDKNTWSVIFLFLTFKDKTARTFGACKCDQLSSNQFAVVPGYLGGKTSTMLLLVTVPFVLRATFLLKTVRNLTIPKM